MKKHRNFFVRIWRNFLAIMIRSELVNQQTKQFFDRNYMNFFFIVAILFLSSCNVTRKVTSATTSHETTNQTVAKQAITQIIRHDSTFVNSNTETVIDETITMYDAKAKVDSGNHEAVLSVTHRIITQKQAVQAGKEVKSAEQADVNTINTVKNDRNIQTQKSNITKSNTAISTYIVIALILISILIILYFRSPLLSFLKRFV
jgi:hypothetical protein